MCNEKPARAASRLSLLLLLAYPFTVHAGVLTGVMWPALVILALLLLSSLVRTFSLRALRYTVLCLVLAGVLLWQAPATLEKVIYAPPLLVTTALLWIFARSLLPGNEPLVSRIARMMHTAPSDRLLRYTRAVTVGWVIFLALMVLEIVVLGVFATQELWSLFTNFYNYLFMAGFFLLEFSLRRFCVDAAERLAPGQFFRRLVSIDYRKVFRES